MNIIETAIPDVKLLRPKRFQDHRGYFAETYNRKALESFGFTKEFLQDNHSLSHQRGTVRGMHMQLPPFAQDKLVRVVRGAVLDVAVDIRPGSPTFGKHVKAVLDADEGLQILVPVGFLHGFVTLTPDVEVHYKVTNYYSPAHDRGVLWNDPALGIDWPITEDEAVLSDKDAKQPTLEKLMGELEAFV